MKHVDDRVAELWALGELEVERAAELAFHARECPICAERLARARSAVLRGEAQAPAPPDVAPPRVDDTSLQAWLRGGGHSWSEVLEIFCSVGRRLAAAQREAAAPSPASGFAPFTSAVRLASPDADSCSEPFGFCAVLYEALYGERPFSVPGELRPPPPGTQVPAWVRRVLLKGLSASPEERYSSIEAVVEALRAGPPLP